MKGRNQKAITRQAGARPAGYLRQRRPGAARLALVLACLLALLPGCQLLPLPGAEQAPTVISPAAPSAATPLAQPPDPAQPTQPPAGPVLTVKSLTEKGDQPLYEIDARWPALEWDGDPRAAAFNQAALQFINTEVARFHEGMEEFIDPNFQSFGSSLTIHFTQTHQEHGLLAVLFNVSWYIAGAAHPASFSHTINYDLRQGQVLALGDLFQPGSPYLERISELCRAELRAKGIIEVEQGTLPVAENFSVWNITPGGLMITFDPYQVAAYAMGTQTVLLPYGQLSDLLAPEGPLAVYQP